MNDEIQESPRESSVASADFSDRLDNIENLLVSIRAAVWLTAIGILALVVYLVV